MKFLLKNPVLKETSPCPAFEYISKTGGGNTFLYTQLIKIILYKFI